jgi:hypothetical protein
MAPTSRLTTVLACIVLCACGGSSGGSGSDSGESITGLERLGWDQPAADAGELASFNYALYVDNTRSEAADVSCGAPATNGRFECTCQLPAMSSGSHTLQIGAFVTDGSGTRESPRSAAVRVVKQ